MRRRTDRRTNAVNVTGVVEVCEPGSESQAQVVSRVQQSKYIPAKASAMSTCTSQVRGVALPRIEDNTE